MSRAGHNNSVAFLSRLLYGLSATDAQMTLIGKLVADLPEDQRPDLVGATRAQASELIDSLKAGTYDPGKWTVSF